MTRPSAWLEIHLAGLGLPQARVGHILVFGAPSHCHIVEEALNLIQQFSTQTREHLKRTITTATSTQLDSEVSRKANLSHINFSQWNDPLMVGILLIAHSEWIRLHMQPQDFAHSSRANLIKASLLTPRRFVEWFCEAHEFSEPETNEMLAGIDQIEKEFTQRTKRSAFKERLQDLIHFLRKP